MARFDDTPLPPHRPPTIELEVAKARARARRWWPILVILLLLTLSTAVIGRLLEVHQDDVAAIEAARQEAAEHRAARFRAEDDLRKLKAPPPPPPKPADLGEKPGERKDGPSGLEGF